VTYSKPSTCFWWSYFLIAVVVWTSPVGAQEPSPEVQKEMPGITKDYVRTKGYVSVYGLGTIPRDENLSVEGIQFRNTDVKGGFGAGMKAGIFPAWTKGFIGAEVEMFGHGGEVAAPISGGQFAQGDLSAIHAMVNIVARYPGQYLQPYVGAGGGGSLGFLTGVDIQIPPVQFTGDGVSGALAYQLFAGMRANLTSRFFVFGEYKYLAANYSWEAKPDIGFGPNLEVELNFRTQIIAAGVGISF